jgi:hypothetical protein
MRKSRGFLAGLALVTLAAASVVAGIEVRAYLRRVPDPRTADKEGVLRWLLLRDLAQEPEEVRRQLVGRLEVLFADSFDADGADRLSPEELEALRRNGEVLKETWFFLKTETYYSLSETDRTGFLDRQIETVARWAKLDADLSAAAASGASATPAPLGDALAAFFDRLDEWTAQAGPEQRARIRTVVRAGLIRWFALYDLSRQDADSRKRLVAGLEKQFAGGFNLSGTTTGMTAAEEATFWKNVDALAQTWFYAKGRAYARLADSQRREFLKAQLDVVEQLSTARQATRTPRAAGERPAAPPPFASRLEAWIAAAPDEERPALRRFATARYTGLILRKIRGFLSPPPAPPSPPAPLLTD